MKLKASNIVRDTFYRSASDIDAIYQSIISMLETNDSLDTQQYRWAKMALDLFLQYNVISAKAMAEMNIEYITKRMLDLIKSNTELEISQHRWYMIADIMLKLYESSGIADDPAREFISRANS